MKYYIYQALFSLLLIFVVVCFFDSYSVDKMFRNYIVGDETEIEVAKNSEYQMSFEAQENNLSNIRVYINDSKSRLSSSDTVSVELTDDHEKVLYTTQAYLYNGNRSYFVIDFDNVSLEKGDWYYLKFNFDNISSRSLLCIKSHNVSSFTEAFNYTNSTEDELSFDLPIGFSKVLNISYYYSVSDLLCLSINLAVFIVIIALLFIKSFFKKSIACEIYRAVTASYFIYLIGEVANVEKRRVLSVFYPLNLKSAFCLLVSIAVIALFYFVVYMIVGKGSIAAIIAAIPFVLLAFVNHTKLVMRGDSFMPWDILSAGIGIKTGSTYYFHLTMNFIAMICLCVCLLIVIRLTDTKYIKFSKTRLSNIFVAVACFGLVFYSCILNTKLLNKLKVYYEVNPPIQSYNENGTYLAFLMHLNNIEAKGGQNNSPEVTEELIYRYTGIASSLELDNRVNNTEFRPNVICIMSEAFSDPRTIRSFETSEPFMPYYDSFLPETLHGNLAVSIFGGGTCNTEFEFLTGYSMANLLPGASVYSFYINGQTDNALPNIFKSNGYRTVALHPFDGSWWDRRDKYPLVGFDEFYTRDDFDESAMYVRRYISDYSTFERITSIYEESDEPLFLFCVTMQNHADFSARYDNMNYNIELSDLRAADGSNYYYAENYLSLLHESDDALEYLIEYLRNSDEPTIVCLFGDHCPTLDPSFYSELLQVNIGQATLEESLPIYQTPYFIWANYDLSEGGTTINTHPGNYGISSPNFLGQTILDLAGIDSPDSRSCLRVLQHYIAGISSLAVFDNQNVPHTTYSEIEPEIIDILDDYSSLEYGLVYYNGDVSSQDITDEG